MRSGGLAAVATGEGLLVAYAAAAGDVAADGDGRNSPYTKALLQHLRSPGVDVRVMLGNVGAAVRTATAADQQPFIYTSLSGTLYLAAPVAVPPVAVPPVASGTSVAVLQQETMFWQSVSQMDTVAAYEEYERKYPNGTFRGLSLVRRAELTVDPPARRRPGDVFRDCEECPEMVVLPGGGLAMGRYEVTVGEYRAFASATGGGAGVGCGFLDERGSSWRDPGFPQTDRHPVTCMGWDDAQEYLSWLSRRTGATYRLPTETEWERAAAGSQPGCDRLGRGTRPDGTCPVGSYGSNPAGLSGMVGNLVEWTSDCWEGNCGRRVFRGGSFSHFAEYLRPGQRSWSYADNQGRGIYQGFRVSRTLD